MKKEQLILLKSLLASANQDALEALKKTQNSGEEEHCRIKLIEETYKELTKKKYEPIRRTN